MKPTVPTDLYQLTPYRVSRWFGVLLSISCGSEPRDLLEMPHTRSMSLAAVSVDVTTAQGLRETGKIAATLGAAAGRFLH